MCFELVVHTFGPSVQMGSCGRTKSSGEGCSGSGVLLVVGVENETAAREVAVEMEVACS